MMTRQATCDGFGRRMFCHDTCRLTNDIVLRLDRQRLGSAASDHVGSRSLQDPNSDDEKSSVYVIISLLNIEASRLSATGSCDSSAPERVGAENRGGAGS